MSGPVEVVLVLAAVCYVMVRRVVGEPAQGRRMLVMPAVLVVTGLSGPGGHLASPLADLFLAAYVAAGVVLGALRGLSVRLTERQGLAFVQYRAVTVALWVANLGVRFGGGLVLHLVDPGAAKAAGSNLLLSLGVGMLVEGLVVLARALRRDHRVMWSEGRDGGPRTMSPWLDSLRETAAGRGSFPRAGAGRRPQGATGDVRPGVLFQQRRDG
jgi:hypothetical protein